MDGVTPRPGHGQESLRGGMSGPSDRFRYVDQVYGHVFDAGSRGGGGSWLHTPVTVGVGGLSNVFSHDDYGYLNPHSGNRRWRKR